MMTHLSDEQLISLAEIEAELGLYDDAQLEQLEHLKTCTECYEKYCAYEVLTDVMSESGSYAWNLKKVPDAVMEAVQAASGRVLAVLRVLQKSAADAAQIVIDQVNREHAALRFAPTLTAAVRGAGQEEPEILRMEEYSDEKTCIEFNRPERKLYIQLNLRYLEIDAAEAYLELEDGTRTEIPLELGRKLAKGTLTDVPAESFSIYIEEP